MIKNTVKTGCGLEECSENIPVIDFSCILLRPWFKKSSMANVPVAIKGYDPVAYFKDGKALKGQESYAFEWRKMAWYFSSKQNRDVFAAAPEKYAPQYDGYCAWAMAEARLAETAPEVWKILDGKLYLNCSQTAYEKWCRDIPGNIKKGDINWLKFQKR